MGFKPWFEQVPGVPKHYKIEATTQPNQQIKNHPKMTTKITKKEKSEEEVDELKISANNLIKQP